MTVQASALVLVVALLVWAALVQGQVGRPIQFGRTGGIAADDSRPGTAFSGRADDFEETGNITTYRGNVILAFPSASLVIRADNVVYDSRANELTLRGNVRLNMDSW